jgi:outer membrane protein assembly factor BamB
LKLQKVLVITIVLTLLFGLAASAGHVFAQPVRQKKTYGFIIVTPNPVGVNQTVLLIFGLTDYLYQWPDGFENITLTVTKPNGQTETLGPYKTDSTGATGDYYKPTMNGTYYFQLHFPGQNYTWPAPPSFDPTCYGTIYYKPCTSEQYALTVQSEPLLDHPGFPLPTEFWSRPVDSQIREWSSIAGNWLGPPPINLYAPYNKGPETPHILWAKNLLGVGTALGGGLTGGVYEYTDEIDDHGFETGDAYEGFFGQGFPYFSRSIILGGVLYFNRYKGTFGVFPVEQEVVAVDIRTGEELWVRNWTNNRVTFGQLFYWDSFNYHAVFPYLIAVRSVGMPPVTYWNFYEASTGRFAFSYMNVPSGTMLYGPKGEIVVYTVNLARGWMTKWNSTHVVTERKKQLFGPTGMVHGSWIGNYFYGQTLNASLGIMWNKTIPTFPGSVNTIFLDDIVIGSQLWGSRMVVGDMPCVLWGIDLRPGHEGEKKFNVTWQKPLGDTAVSWVAASNKERVFVLCVKETRQLYAFDMDTGIKKWGPSEALDIRGVYGVGGAIAYGKLILSINWAGIINCYDVKNGSLLWTYEVEDPYAHSEMWQKEFAGDMWPTQLLFITDGKVYIGSGEHSPENPLPRGAPFICLNVTDGTEIFRVNGLLRQTHWGGPAIIGDSIIISMDTYDMRIYSIGKGPSATTITTSPRVVANGQTIVIDGTVMDISPGTKDSSIALRFPNGVPAVADESMGDWMLYVYKQFPRPTNVEGVWVKLDAINVYTGEVLDIGGTHTDSAGMFTVAWAPPKEGLWTILATFPGSNSYYPSFAETSIAVTGAPAAPAAPAYTTLDLAIIVAVIIAIIIGIANLYIILKKK